MGIRTGSTISGHCVAGSTGYTSGRSSLFPLGTSQRRRDGDLDGQNRQQGQSIRVVETSVVAVPLCISAMELSALLESKGQRLLLRWAPREVNAEADRLANGNCSGFDPLKRVWVDVRSGPWLVLDKLLELGKGFYSHMNEFKLERLRKGCKRRRRAAEKNTLGKW